MGIALAEAACAGRDGEVPVGAVLVWDGQIIAADHNRREQRADPLAHAELLVIGAAARQLGRWRLERAALVVTLEPCPMCMGAVLQARIPLLAYGAADPKAGAAGSLFDLADDPRLNHAVTVLRGVQGDAAGALLQTFFRERRGP